MALFVRHPKYGRMSKHGIKFIYVGKDLYGYRCFFIKLGNGGVDSFSIKKCIDSKDDSLFIKFQQACRTAVIDQIISFKNSSIINGNYVSAISGNIIPIDDVHVDHVYYFLNLVVDFISEYSIDLNTVEFDSDIPMTMSFRDLNLIKKFSEFHRKHAELRIVSSYENLTRKKPTIKRNI